MIGCMRVQIGGVCACSSSLVCSLVECVRAKQFNKNC